MQAVSPTETPLDAGAFGIRNGRESGNLDAPSQDTQLRVGLASFTVAIAAAAGICAAGASPLLRTVVFVPFFIAAYGVFAALYATCGISALAGMRYTCHGSERIADRHERLAHRTKGAKVLAMSVLSAAIATALFVTAS